jgi:hypothetical protein
MHKKTTPVRGWLGLELFDAIYNGFDDFTVR